MLPLKMIRGMTRDHRVQKIAEAISMTSNVAAYKYLEGADARALINKQANKVKLGTNLNDNWPMGELWVDREWSTHFKFTSRRKV